MTFLCPLNLRYKETGHSHHWKASLFGIISNVFLNPTLLGVPTPFLKCLLHVLKYGHRFMKIGSSQEYVSLIKSK